MIISLTRLSAEDLRTIIAKTGTIDLLSDLYQEGILPLLKEEEMGSLNDLILSQTLRAVGNLCYDNGT